jgi:hypothetical protein
MIGNNKATGNASKAADGQKNNTHKIYFSAEIIKPFLKAGLSVIPCNPKTKRPTIAWKAYQQASMTDVGKYQWPGVAIICGQVSGGLECLDFDFKAAWFDDWTRLVTDEAPDLLKSVLVQKTQSGGLHIVFRCTEPIHRNQKLATDLIQVKLSETYEKDGKRFFSFQKKELEVHEVDGKLFVYPCYIETRGQGGYFLAAPTSGYSITQGDFLDLPIISAQKREILINSARVLNRKPPDPERIFYQSHNGDRRPGDLYNEQADLRPLLEQAGWKLAGSRENLDHFTRPGKAKGISASLYDGKVFHVFSSNATPFELDKSYAPFSVYTLLKHGGDYEAAAKDLKRQGYGDDPSFTIGESGQKPEPLPDELLPVASFDFDLLPESLRPWAEDICNRMQCPPDFVGVAIMAGLSGVIGRKVAVRPQEKTDWTVICNQWALLVGRPSVLKSPAMEQALIPLKALAARAGEKYAEALQEFKVLTELTKLKKDAAEKTARAKLKENPAADEKDLLAVLAVDGPDAPGLKRYIVNDTTPASLGEVLRQNPNGLLVYRDELVSLLKGLDREGQEEGRGFYLTGWNGDSPYTFDRIGRGLNLHIKAVCFSVLGSTQPGRLSEYIRYAVKGGMADDGLIQRFGLLVWPDTNGVWRDVDRWPDSEGKKQAFNVFQYLDNLDPTKIGTKQDTNPDGEPEGPPYLRFDREGLGLFREWRADLETRLRGDLHPALESHFAKYRKLIPGLALIIHLADGNTGPVTESAVLQALAWGEYLETHAQRAYASVSQPEISVAKAIIRRIKKGDLPPLFSSRDVWRPGWALLSDREQVIKALETLGDYNWVSSEKIETGGKPATIYKINPQVLK